MSVDVIIASHSGIRERGSDQGEYSRKPILKDADGYGAWRVKMETIVDADDRWEIGQGREVEPINLAHAAQVDKEGEVVENPPTAADALLIAARRKEIKDFKRRHKKDTSVITQSVDDGIVPTLTVHNKDPK